LIAVFVEGEQHRIAINGHEARVIEVVEQKWNEAVTTVRGLPVQGRGFPPPTKLPARKMSRHPTGGRHRFHWDASSAWCCCLWATVGRLASTGMVSASEVRARRCAAGIILTRAAVDKRHLDHTSLLPMSDSDASCELSARIDDRIETECE
jgi:hypothetical protein